MAVARALFIACALGALGCGGEPRARSPRPALFDEPARSAGYRTPAVLRYHPAEEAALNARFDWGTYSLYAGARGERWMYDARGRRAEAAPTLAPEDLVAIVRRNAAWLFVGKSGTVYEAREPLGPFVRKRVPFEPLVEISGSADTLVAVRRDRTLARSSNGGGEWQPVGPHGVQFVDVAQAPSGMILALAAPEELWQSTDRGDTWNRVPAPSFAAASLASDGAALVVHGLLEDRRFEAGTLLPGQPVQRAAPLTLGVHPVHGPDAGALREGRAAIVSGRYLELARDPNSRADWQLWEGPLEGELAHAAFPRARGCEVVRLAAFGRAFYLACWRRLPTASAEPVELFRSDDGGKSFDPEPLTAEARVAQFAMAAGASGAVMLTGLCAPREDPSGCKPYGIYYAHSRSPRSLVEAGRRDQRTAVAQPKLGLSATPSLSDTALGLTFSPDGHVAYAVARRTKSNALALYVSHDGAKNFTARELDDTPAEPDDELDEDRSSYRSPPPSLELGSITSGTDGNVAIVVRRYGTLALIVTDAEGHPLSNTDAPPDSNALGAAGSLALAISAQHSTLWESLDAGATWRRAGRLPLSICPGDERCRIPVACHPGGCVIADELSRIGWGGSSDEVGDESAAAERNAPSAIERRLATPLSCALLQPGWQRLAHVQFPPGVDQAAIGRAVWFALAADSEHAAASVYHGLGGARPRVESVSLFAAARRPRDFAFASSRQVEGAAALRYVVPEASAGATHLRDVEVAWDNLFDGRVVRARLADAGAYEARDYERSGGAVQVAEPALLSIASGGIYLRIHKLAGDRQPTLFLDGNKVVSIPPVAWPKLSGRELRPEIVHVGDAHVPLLLAGDGSAIVRARALGSGWAFDAYASGVSDPKRFGLEASADLSYVGGKAALHVTTWGEQADGDGGKLFVFRATGPVVDAPVNTPMQSNAGEPPRACTTSERSATARVIVPFEAGTRRPLLVTDPSEPMRLLLTNGAVMHGTPAEACVAAYEADTVPLDNSSASERARAIVPLDDLEHAWLFRLTSDAHAEVPSIEYRMMRCRFDSSAEVPPEVYRAAGTTRIRQ